MKKRYDLIFSVGNACSCSQSIRAAGLQHLSFPFDWLAIDERTDLRLRTDLIRTDFADWLEKSDLEFVSRSDWHPKDVYRNTRTGIYYNHDFDKGLPFDRAYDQVVEKYRRRIDRLFQCIRESKRVLVVRLDRPNQSVPSKPEDCRLLLDMLRSKFPSAHFDMFLFAFAKGVSPDDLREEDLGDGITRVSFDYKDYRPEAPDYAPDLSLTGAVLKARFTVKDYRTSAERRAFARRRRQDKYRAYGATTYLGYKLEKMRRKFLERIAPRLSPRVLAAWFKRRRFEQIVPLGVNCEVAFRFYRKWGFLDSSLFAWAQVYNLRTLSAALERLDATVAGRLTLDDDSKMWRCDATGVCFHGKLKWKPGAPPPSEKALAEDLADLRGRLAHLVDKFRAALTNGRPTLFVHRLSEADAASATLAADLDRLESVLRALGAGDFTLLVICERKFIDRMPAAPGRFYRAVNAYNPGDAITTAYMGDPAGWNAAFTEFAPAVILPKKHDFKFE